MYFLDISDRFGLTLFHDSFTDAINVSLKLFKLLKLLYYKTV